MRVDYSMLERFEVKGNPKVVMSRGEVIVGNGVYMAGPTAAGF